MDRSMLTWLTQLFTWWNGQTLNTRFHTWRFGEVVGHDDLGNIYYRTAGGKIDPALGFERRWVIFNGPSEGSSVPPGWYGWLHHTFDVPPTQETYVSREWEMPHLPNMTGTAAAYRPAGSTLGTGVRQAASGDYQAWTPGN
jgi:NADH:ubiquinone oxidoreductase subunit